MQSLNNGWIKKHYCMSCYVAVCICNKVYHYFKFYICIYNILNIIMCVTILQCMILKVQVYYIHVYNIIHLFLLSLQCVLFNIPLLFTR